MLVDLQFPMRPFLYKLVSVGGGNGRLTLIPPEAFQPLKSAV